jgi:hypothetical protein|tara:strand:+ start:76 stop:594 length:519 start_codon:yes stop_codon:yes gene_type:complete
MAIYFPNSEIDDLGGEVWRITSSFTGSQHPMLNWEKSDDVYGSGSGLNILSCNNGVFSINSSQISGNGSWFLLNWHNYAYHNDNSRWIQMELEVSWNNGGNYDNHGYATSDLSPNSTSNYNTGGSATGFILGNSVMRFRWKMNAQNSGVTTYGYTDATATGFSIVKIASENP